MPLPAPYRNPWRNLADDLRAVVADLRLRLQELWRRNGQGTLWRPTWWPADLAPLFWPLLLVLMLVLVGVASAGAVVALRRGEVAPLPPAGDVVVAPEPEAEPEALVEPERGNETETETETELEREPAVLTPAVPVEPWPAPEAPAAEQQPPDPLAELLQRPEADELLLSARVLPDQLSLVLELSPRFQALPVSEQQHRAEQWLQWAQELGYDHLELRDPGAVLLARDALVGGGMIVLNPSSGP
jgi:hypothetical protein